MNAAEEIRIQKIVALIFGKEGWTEDDSAELAATLAAVLDFSKSAGPMVSLLIKDADSIIDKKELQDRVLDIGEELRHLLYHVEASRFFGYLRNSSG